MKKLIIFTLVLIGIASCQKEVIRPNCSNTTSYEKTSSTDNSSVNTNDDTTPVLDGEGNPIDGDITDPLRKRDKN